LFLFSAVSVVGNGLHATTTSGRLALDPVVAFVVSAIPAVALLQGSHLFVVMLSAPASRPDISLAQVGAATRTMPAPTNRQPSTGRDGRGQAEVVAVGGTHLLPSAAVNGDGSRSRASARPKGDLDMLQARFDKAAREGSAGDRRRRRQLAGGVPTDRSATAGRPAHIQPGPRPTHRASMNSTPSITEWAGRSLRVRFRRRRLATRYSGARLTRS
jgi:hypothetical protein